MTIKEAYEDRETRWLILLACADVINGSDPQTAMATEKIDPNMRPVFLALLPWMQEMHDISTVVDDRYIADCFWQGWNAHKMKMRPDPEALFFVRDRNGNIIRKSGGGR